MAYYYTKDIPSKSLVRTEIRSNTLKVLKTLLTNDYIRSNKKNFNTLRTLQKHFKVIKRSQIDGKKTIYYLKDKNKKALKSIIENKGTRVISYHELANMSNVFDVKLSKKEKKTILSKKNR